MPVYDYFKHTFSMNNIAVIEVINYSCGILSGLRES